jgi:hypothetical protein
VPTGNFGDIFAGLLFYKKNIQNFCWLFLNNFSGIFNFKFEKIKNQ